MRWGRSRLRWCDLIIKVVQNQSKSSLAGSLRGVVRRPSRSLPRVFSSIARAC
jgi:hypothetical protein